VHTVAVPRLGGIGIFLSLAVAVAFYLVPDRFSFGFLAGLLIIVLTGLIDDIKPLSHRFKFAGEIAAVVAFVGVSGSELSGVGNLFGFGDVAFGPLAFMATVFCMVGLINAMNLSDGLDGLAGGMAIIAALFFAILGYKTGQINVMIIALALAGSLLGFLLYNGFPARLFMGDVGSLMIGYTCAVLAVQIMNAPTHAFAIQPITIALILAVPLLDTLVVMGARMLKGMSPFKPDKTHLHHRLMGLGLSQNQAVSIMYMLMFVYCAIALLGLHVAAYWQFYMAIGLTMLVYGSIHVIARKPYRAIATVSMLSHRVGRLESMLVHTLFDVNKHYSRAVSFVLVALAIIPLLFLGQQGLLLMGLAMALLSLLFFMRQQNQRVLAILQGLLYILILSLLFVYNRSFDYPAWGSYWAGLSSVSIAWVILTLLVGHTRRKLALHSFEILLILLSWVVFFLVMPLLNFAPTGGEDVRIICIYAIPLLLVAKLCIVSAKRVSSLHGEVGEDALKQI